MVGVSGVLAWASLIDSTHKVNLSRNEGALQNQNTRSFSARGLTYLELEVGNLTSRSVVSKVLISEAKESGETNGSGRLRL